MGDLISRKALLAEIKERYDLEHGETIIDPYYFAEIVEDAPAVETEPTQILKAEINLYDKEGIYENCTVQVLANTVTGEVSVGWWQNDNAPEVLNE